MNDMDEQDREHEERKLVLLEHLVCAQMDDHRDAARLADYAESAHDAGEKSAAAYFAQRAKARIASAAEAERYIDDLMPPGGGADRMMYRKALRRYQEESAASLKRRLDGIL